jgi:two-component sensor histidine kinase
VSTAIPWRIVLAGGLAFATLAGLISYGFTLATGRALWTLEADPSASFSYVMLMNQVYWNAWALLTPAIFLAARRHPITRERWISGVLLHLVMGSAFVAVHSVLASSGRVWLQTWYGMEVPWGAAVRDHLLRTYDWELTYYAAAAGVWHAWHFRGEAQRRAAQAAELELALVRAQLLALQRQVHPHFLFNTLHVISAFVRRQPDAAEEMLERLSELLRLTLRRSDAHEVPLADELHYLNAYLAIEQVHFGTRLSVSIDVEPAARGVLVPSLLLQPLVENAIRHGIAPRAAGGRVTLRACLSGLRLALTVEDDGVGLRSETASRFHSGVGTANVRARLERLYGSQQRMAFVQRPGGGLIVEVSLPARLAERPEREQASAGERSQALRGWSPHVEPLGRVGHPS